MRIATYWKYRKRLFPVMRALVNTWTSPNKHLYGSVSPAELSRLKHLVEKTVNGTVYEFGTLFGHTALAMASTGAMVTTVDNLSWNPFGMSQAEHREFLKRNLAGSEVVFRETDNDDFRWQDLFRAGLVFIDSKHDFATTAFLLKLCRQAEVTTIVCHDVHSEFPGVVRAVELFAANCDEYVCNKDIGTLWVAERR